MFEKKRFIKKLGETVFFLTIAVLLILNLKYMVGA